MEIFNILTGDSLEAKPISPVEEEIVYINLEIDTGSAFF